MNSGTPAIYSVEAYNLSHASENKIHDDAVARTLGFSGGLVPGVEVYAYACHPAVERWGRSWLERGQMQCRFVKPVYDGHIASISSQPTGPGLDIKVESRDVLCATATASMREETSHPPDPEDYPLQPPVQSVNRPPADETSLATGKWLGITPVPLTRETAAQYLRDVRETDPIYHSEQLAHPGFLLRLCNLVLRENVVLPPWIHTGSSVTNFAAARVGDELSARARVAANYERKGHRLVDLDVLLIANKRTAIARVLHTAIYRLAQLAKAS